MHSVQGLHNDGDRPWVTAADIRRVRCAGVITVLFEQTDNLMRDAALARSSARVEYIQGQLNEERLAEQRQVLIDFLASELESSVLAKVDKEFAAQIIEPPIVSPRPTSPKLLIVFALATFLGLCNAIVIILLTPRFRRGATHGARK